jgi:hypothetical protein
MGEQSHSSMAAGLQNESAKANVDLLAMLAMSPVGVAVDFGDGASTI